MSCFPFTFVLLFCFLCATLIASKTYTVGVLNKDGDALTISQWQPTFRDFLTTMTNASWAQKDYSFDMIPVGFDGYEAAIESGTIDLVFANSALFSILNHEYSLEPLVTLVNLRDGRNLFQFGGVLLANASNTSIQTWEDCVGLHNGAVAENSFGGYMMQVYEFPGIEEDVVFLDTHEAVAEAVLDGTIACGMVRTDTLERKFPTKLDQFVVLDPRLSTFPFYRSTKLYPEWPVAAVSSVPNDVREFLVSALGAVSSTDDCAVAGKYAGWFPALSYDTVEVCLRSLGIIVDPDEESNEDNGLNMWIIVGPAIGFFVILSIVLGLWLRMYLTRRRQEREAEKFAPKEGEMLILFTDIESSSKLWEMLPMNVMHDAVQRHNAILRKLLVKHSGYEVKTQGDSFFVVFGNPSDGIRWSFDVQKELVNENWHPALVEAVERAISEAKDRPHEDDKIEKDEKTVSFGRSTIIDENERRNPPVWNGLRVRIGGCVGEPTYVKDPSTRRFDYYGPDVNRAARIGDMAYGGQIVFSERVEPYLDDLLKASVELKGNEKTPKSEEFVVHPQGIFNLKGVNSEEAVIQVMPLSLSGRKFPSLVSRKSSLSGAALFTALPNTVMKKLKYFSVGMYLIWDEFEILPPWLSMSGRSVDMDPTLELLREGNGITLDLFKVSKSILGDVASSRSGGTSTGRSVGGQSTGKSKNSSSTSLAKYKEAQVLPVEDV
eukprot:TRINITY_DN2118_c0_g1_i1.p1 TRINITY_DN2118_c0_g1~~TRINITY_DN2118_c0_g1_i1.p1  ORF type:complete len:718 (-),score=166.81 TRINITY_DN2118_c0_g1_i1:334-2487(-)